MVELLVLLSVWIISAIGRWFIAGAQGAWFCFKWMCKITWFLISWACKLVIGAIAIVIGFVLTIFFPTIGEKKQPKVANSLDYEMYCGKYLLSHGFHDVYTTPPSGDYGADLVAKDANGAVWVFQCKHYNSKVGNSFVQEVVAAKKHYGAEKAAVMTNSQLTQKARELAIENEVLLFELLSD